MISDTFVSAGATYKLHLYTGPADGKKHPVVVLVHGNFGLAAPYGEQIQGFAKDLAAIGYLAAVPHYYTDDQPNLTDTQSHDQTLAEAIASLGKRPDADLARLGLVGFSLGAATAMTFMARHPAGTVKAFADFFGFLTPAIRSGVSKFPPTIIFHNLNDQIVDVENSRALDMLLPSTIEHWLVPPYVEHWQAANHAFQPGGAADVDSRTKARDWFVKHMPPVGV